MDFGSLQTAQVTSAARMIGGTSRTYYWGFTSYINSGTTECTLVISGATISSVTGVNIHTWMTIKSGSSVANNYINSVWPQPIRCFTGLRGKLVGGHSGCTVIVHFGG